MVAPYINADLVVDQLRVDFGKSVALHERRPGVFQVILPVFHEDGDMLDIYLQASILNSEMIRICDFGMTLMRLSYSYEINTKTREQIFESILAHNDVSNDGGNLYLDSTADMLFHSILKLTGCVQKICNMRYWHREIVRSEFMKHFNEYVGTKLRQYEPRQNTYPLSEDYKSLTVDWQLTHSNRNFYLFGVGGESKAKSTAITLLEFQKAGLSFLSLVIYENMEELSSKTRTCLTNNANKRFSTLEDFRKGAKYTIERMAA